MKKYLEALNGKQREAVLHTGPPLLILAGAGSGKTRVITTKIAYLIEEQGINPHSILAVTFTNKAAEEMKNRVQDITPLGGQVMVRTFHSFGAWLLRRNARALGLSENFVIYDEDDKLSLLKLILARTAKGKPPAGEIKRLSNSISRAKECCLHPGDGAALSEIDFKPDFEEVYKLYAQKLQEIGNVDFGDLIMRPVLLLKQFPEIRNRIRSRFRVVLVDEFQDSNHAQLELLKQLHHKDNYLCVVGDEDQSIYKFRGAEVRNIIEFPEIFPSTEVVMLEQNYRSTPNILDVAINVVNHNHYRMGKNLWTEIPRGQPVHLALLPDQDAEARFVAQLLQDGQCEGTAILYRNNFQSRAFETLFENYGIPYKIVGSLRFYEREEVKDVLAWLHLLVNPRDEVSFLRIINKPARGIGKKTISTIRSVGGADMLVNCRQTLETLPARARICLKEFISLYNGFFEHIESNALASSIEEIFVRSGLLEHYTQQDKEHHSAKVQNLYELMNAAGVYPTGLEGVGGFLETITLSGNEESSEEGRVTLITVHNTKGLEFERVILTGLEDGLFPHVPFDPDELDEEDVEEERRLFYVGITRARRELYLTSCQSRRMYGEMRQRYPSRFIDEIPGDLLDVLGPRRDEDTFCVGDCVRHADYGRGTVIDKGYNGNTLVVVVDFDSGRQAQLIPKYNKLERIF